MSRTPPVVDVEALLRHAEFLRTLARSLLRDEQHADDVVQDTMVVALERRDGLRPDARGWLSVVARNFARMTHRSEARRVHRERAAARPESVDSAALAAARLKIQRRVVAAVQALRDPYRATVVERVFEGLTPAEIARRQGVPVKTVYTRLRRALDRLRARLDDDHGGDRRAWCMALLPAALSRRVATATLFATCAGVLFMKAKLVLALIGVATTTKLDRIPLWEIWRRRRMSLSCLA